MKTVLTVAVLSTLGMTAGLSFAGDYADTAQVISATPIYDRVSSPRRECVNEQVSTYEERRVRREVVEPVADTRYDSRNDSRNYGDSGSRGIGAGTVLGAIIGGAIGHQFGNSSGGRDRGTAAGAIIGGMIGHSAENDNRADTRSYDSGYRRTGGRERYDVERVPVTRDVQRCNVVNDYRDEVRGYDVRYRYAGREYNTRLSYDPGPTMQVNVDVRPAYRAPAPAYSNRY